MDKLEVAKAKLLRGNIISKLYDFYGDDITVATLKQVMSYGGYNSDKDIKRAIYYLTGPSKRYIKLVYNKYNYMDSLIWLTPEGVNLAEGDLEDIGVELDE